MSDTPLCPTCHSKIGTTPRLINRTQGSDGLDSSGNPIPVWSNDPIITPTGLNGGDYIGSQFPKDTDIIEIQTARKQQEEDAGISPLTEFSTIQKNITPIQPAHIIELRISTERILDAVGSTLSDYFQNDIEGNIQPPGPNDVPNKSEWTDVLRGTSFNSNGLNQSILIDNNTEFKLNSITNKSTPTLSPGLTFIRGIHIEDLRHPILSTWLELFKKTTPISNSISISFPDSFTATSTNIIFGDRNDYDIQLNTNFAGVGASGSFASADYSISSSEFLNKITNKIDISLLAEATATPVSLSVSTFTITPTNEALNSFNSPKLKFTNNLVVDIFTSNRNFDSGSFLTFNIIARNSDLLIYSSNQIQFTPIEDITTFNIYNLFSSISQAALNNNLVSFYIQLTATAGAEIQSPYISVPSSTLSLTLNGFKIRKSV